MKAGCRLTTRNRWWSAVSNAHNFELNNTPTRVEFLSGIADFLREVLIGREHMQKVPQWYGERIGFWDGDILITWTANVQGWTQHTLFEFSDKMETVETFQPLYDAAVTSSAYSTRRFSTTPSPSSSPCDCVTASCGGPTQATRTRYTFIECLSNIRNVKGRPVQQTKGDPNFIDYYGRAWAQNWEQWFEQGWEKPDDNAVPKDVIDLFK